MAARGEVCFGSRADIAAGVLDVSFGPEADIERVNANVSSGPVAATASFVLY